MVGRVNSSSITFGTFSVVTVPLWNFDARDGVFGIGIREGVFGADIPVTGCGVIGTPRMGGRESIRFRL